MRLLVWIFGIVYDRWGDRGCRRLMRYGFGIPLVAAGSAVFGLIVWLVDSKVAITGMFAGILWSEWRAAERKEFEKENEQR